jgi:hypothetical protein
LTLFGSGSSFLGECGSGSSFENKCGSRSCKYVKKTFVKVKKIMLNFYENKVTINIFLPITVIFILFMPNYLSFVSVIYLSSFLLFLNLLDQDPHSECGPGYGSRRPIECGSMRIRIRNTGSRKSSHVYGCHSQLSALCSPKDKSLWPI